MSGETKFTPGPWRASGHYVITEAGMDVIKRVGKRSATVADCRIANGENDAHLIAASPELYAALEGAISNLESAGINVDAFGGAEDDPEYIEACRAWQSDIDRFKAALRKARGESQ